MQTGFAVVGGCALVLGAFLAVTAFIAWLFMLAWNAFVPAAFGGSEISFGVAFAGCILLGIIGSFFRSTFSAKS